MVLVVQGMSSCQGVLRGKVTCIPKAIVDSGKLGQVHPQAPNQRRKEI